jgi:hypothetical protein
MVNAMQQKVVVPRWVVAASIAVGAALGSLGCDADDVALETDASTDASAPDTGSSDGATSGSDGGTKPGADAGAPIAKIATTAIDLGLTDCGGTATAKTLTIQNTGGGALTVGAAVVGTGFTVSPANVTVAAGQTATFSVSASVAATSTAGTALAGSLKLTTNDPTTASVTVPLSVTPQGATLVFNTGSPTSADFGQSKINVAANIALTVKNVGNKSAAFAFAAPSNAQFGMSSTPASPATLAANASAALSARFTPTTVTTTTATSAITVTGAVCGASVNKVSFSGQGSTGAVTGWPSATFDFGLNACGGAAASAKTFTLVNSGAAAVNITGVTFAGSLGYTTNATTSSVVPAGGQLVVSVMAPAIPTTSLVPGNYAGSLTVTTDLPSDTPHIVSLTEGALGAVLAFDTTASPNFGSFGNVPVGTFANEGFSVVNTGNAAANVTLATTTPFGVLPAMFSIAGSASETSSASFTPSSTAPQTGTIAMTATGLCQPAPAPLALSGTGQNGGVSLSDTSIAFSANCGSTAPPKTFTITNSGNSAMTWNASLAQAGSSVYTLSSTTATLAAGDSSTVTLTPAAIAQYPSNVSPSAYADTVNITTDIVGDTSHTINVSETPLGAVLAIAPVGLAFGPVPVNTTSAARSFAITNNGNAGSAVADVALSGSNAKFALSSSTASVAVGSPSSTDVTFSPGATAGNETGAVTLTTSSPLCAPLPSALTESGTGTLAQVTVTPSVVDFANVNCGTNAAAQTVTFTNPGNQDYAVTSLALTKGTYFTVSMLPATGIVPANNGGSVVITVTPNAIPQSVPSVPDLGTYSDTLTVTTNAAQDTPHNIPLNMGAQGVILKPFGSTSWAFGSVNYGATGYYAVPVRNDGNVATTLTLTGTTLPVFGFTTTSVAASASTILTGSFTPSSNSQSYADTGTLVVPSGTVFCQPQPANVISLSGQGANGAILTMSGSLTFPSETCAGPAVGAQNVTITNNSNSPLPYSTSFQVGSWYAVTGGATGTIAANGGTAIVTVQPLAVPTAPGQQSGSAAYADALLVTMNGGSYSTPIAMTVRGAMLSIVTNGNGYGNGFYVAYWGNNASSAPYNSYVPVSNTGNVNAPVTAVFSGDDAAAFSLNPMSGTAPAGSSFSGQLNYNGSTPGCLSPLVSYVTYTTTAPVCSPAETGRVSSCGQ